MWLVLIRNFLEILPIAFISISSFFFARFLAKSLFLLPEIWKNKDQKGMMRVVTYFYSFVVSIWIMVKVMPNKIVNFTLWQRQYGKTYL